MKKKNRITTLTAEVQRTNELLDKIQDGWDQLTPGQQDYFASCKRQFKHGRSLSEKQEEILWFILKNLTPDNKEYLIRKRY